MQSLFLIIYLISYIIILGTILLSHVFTGNYIKSFESKSQKCEKYWIGQWNRATARSFSLARNAVRKIRKPYYLVGLKEFVSGLSKSDSVLFWKNNVSSLGKYVAKMNNIIKAYYAFLICNITFEDDEIKAQITDLMQLFLHENSVHLRENSLKALYRLGMADRVRTAYVYLSAKNISHSEKLLSDGLCLFSGDKSELAFELMSTFANLDDCYRKAVVNFLMRENIHNYDMKLTDFLLHDRVSNDIQCSIVRLLGKVCTNESGLTLARYVNGHDEAEEWEGISVAMGMLGSFERTDYLAETLCKGLTARNWYIRMNSAKSLCRMGITAKELEEIKKMFN